MTFVRPELRTLSGWLDYLQTLHPAGIALGLERVRAVAEKLQIRRIANRVITVAGTNGKGSSVAILASILRAAGQRVGCYTSPHLVDYRERIELPGGWVSEAELLDAFERVEEARGTVPLTVFEFGTLAALLCFAAADLDVAILEVGLGGRLDAVNIMDADAVLITTIDLDHQAWLGDDRTQIGREKAGVLRAGQVAVYADQPPVGSVLDVAASLPCALRRPGFDYRYWRQGECWFWHNGSYALQLPWPEALQAPCQIHNLAACMALILALQPDFPSATLSKGIARVRVNGRLQRLSNRPEIWLDIAHNPQAAASLCDWLQTQPKRRTLAVFGALADKDVEAVLVLLAPYIDHWFLVSLQPFSPRGMTTEQLQARMPAAREYSVHPDPVAGVQTALSRLLPDHDRLLIFGSFVLAEQVLRWSGWTRSVLPVSITGERQ